MLSHKVLKREDVGKTVQYYSDADDYYAKEGGATAWQGKGAHALGLSGEVDPERFRQLLAGRVQPGQKAVRGSTRLDRDSRIGIDFTFSAPKSVSIQALVGRDPKLIRAHDTAVARTMKVAEQFAQASVKVRRKKGIETTANLVVARFRHETSREKDPHLHTHAIVMNLTRRRDGAWRALVNDQLVKSTKYLGAVYRAELAAELTKLGYELRLERDGMFELARVSRDELAAFSVRSAQIQQALADRGLTRESASTAQKQLATLQTRKPKTPADRDELHRLWRERAAELRISLEPPAGRLSPAALQKARAIIDDAPRAQAARDCVKFAAQHLTERQAIVSRGELLNIAVEHAMGRATLVDIEREIDRRVERGLLVKEAPVYHPAYSRNGPVMTPTAWAAELHRSRGLSPGAADEEVRQGIAARRLVLCEERYTTPRAIDREEAILRIERDGRGSVTPAIAPELVRARLEETTLSKEQREAIAIITGTTNRVIAVQGFAGTGKSHMLLTAKGLLEEAGYTVQTAAPYSGQARRLRDEGLPCSTVASILASRTPEKYLGSRTVLFVDESGVLPARLMSRLQTLAERHGTRVVYLGDTGQTKAIEAGRPFAQLQEAGTFTAKLEDVRRQTERMLRWAVTLAARGDPRRSLLHIEDVRQIADHDRRREAVAEAFARLSPAARDQTIVVSGTNEARRKINDLIRAKVGTAGKGTLYDTLTRIDTTQEMRKHSKNYDTGWVVQPERDYKRTGLQRGKLYRVEENGPGDKLTVRQIAEEGRLGEAFSFNPHLSRKLSVYRPDRIELSIGDRVRVTRNDATRDLANGDRAVVKEVSAESVLLAFKEREVSLPARTPLHLDLAYATTVHSAQGQTCDRVLVDLDTTSRTTTRDVYYVAISRAREQAIIFTNDTQRLPAAIARAFEKHAALDLARDRDRLAKRAPEHELGR